MPMFIQYQQAFTDHGEIVPMSVQAFEPVASFSTLKRVEKGH